MAEALSQLYLDTSKFNTALDRMVVQSKRELGDLLREQARGFIRKAVSITPPSQGDAGKSAQRAGEASIEADYKNVFPPMDEWFTRRLAHIAYQTSNLDDHKAAEKFQERFNRYVAGGNRAAVERILRCLHFKEPVPMDITYQFALKYRDRKTGHLRKDRRFVSTPKSYDEARKAAKKRVGRLAAGFNAAASALGVKPPKWIATHGESQGHVVIDLEGDKMRILISNDVSYAQRVEDLQRRLQKALDWQARDMNRRVDEFARKTAKV